MTYSGQGRGWKGHLYILGLAVAGLIVLSACTAIGMAVEKKIEFNDNKARVLKRMPCDMAIGAYHRTLTDLEQAAVDALCGGDIKPLIEITR